MLNKAVALSAIAGAAAFAPAGMPAGVRARSGASTVCMAADNSAPPADLFNIWRQDYMVSPAAAEAADVDRKANAFFDGVLPPFSNVGNTGRGSIPVPPKHPPKHLLQWFGINVKRKASCATPEPRAVQAIRFGVLVQGLGFREPAPSASFGGMNCLNATWRSGTRIVWWHESWHETMRNGLPNPSTHIQDNPRLRGLGIAADFSTANPTSAYDTEKFGTVYLPNKDVVIGATGISPAQAIAARMKNGIKNVQRVNSLNPYAVENKEGQPGRDYSALGIPLAYSEEATATKSSGTTRAPARAAAPRAPAPVRGTVRAGSAPPAAPVKGTAPAAKGGFSLPSLPSFPNPFLK